MRALDIPPHSHGTSRLAVTGLALIAGFALTSGFLRQVVRVPPPHQAVAAGPGTDTIAEATPAPEPTLQVAEPPPRHVHATEPVDLSDEIAPAEGAPAADAAATAPDPTPPIQPADPPTQSDGVTL